MSTSTKSESAIDRSAKIHLARKINEISSRRGLSQAEVGRILGMSQPKVSAIRNHKLNGISLERLMRALTALGQHVEIVVSPSNEQALARINVAA